MKSTLFLLLFFGSSHCKVENKISKVICSLCPYKDVDLLKGSLDNQVKLSKDLFKECNIRFRIVTSDVSDFGKKNLMSFASLENQNKETLWPFQTDFFFSKCHLPNLHLTHLDVHENEILNGITILEKKILLCNVVHSKI